MKEGVWTLKRFEMYATLIDTCIYQGKSIYYF